MLTNGTGQGLLAEDWDHDAATPPRPAVVPAPVTPPENTPPALPQILPGLIVPEGVALMLDTALAGDSAPAGTPGRDGRPRSKNLTVLIGTVRVFGAQRGGPRRVTTRLGAVEYRYELQINEVVGDDTAAARSSYSLPISMSDAVRTRYEHLLVDGQRIALLGPLGMEEYYDQRYQRDAYDAGRRTWDIRIDVLGVQEVGPEVPDAAWVQLEGEVVDRPRIYGRQYGERRDLVERYAGVTLRYREVLAGPYGMAVRPVVKSIPVEVLVTPDEELIPASDALLRPGNKVRIEGRLSPAAFRLPRRDVESEVVQSALSRAREDLVARNAALERQQTEVRAQRQAQAERGGQRTGTTQTPRQAPLSTEALERRIARVQQSLLTGRRVRVEVGYVELLHGEAATPEERIRLIAESEARQRQMGRPRSREMAATELPGAEEIAGAIDEDVGRVVAAQAASADVPDDAPERTRPRRRPAPRSGESSGPDEEPVAL